MKVLFLFLTFFISINSIAQSKKEQIDMLNVRVDSLNSEYVKDTTLLSNTVREVNKENVDLSEQLEKSKEQLKKEVCNDHRQVQHNQIFKRKEYGSHARVKGPAD